jgi:hypothetical protein
LTQAAHTEPVHGDDSVPYLEPASLTVLGKLHDLRSVWRCAPELFFPDPLLSTGKDVSDHVVERPLQARDVLMPHEEFAAGPVVLIPLVFLVEILMGFFDTANLSSSLASRMRPRAEYVPAASRAMTRALSLLP